MPKKERDKLGLKVEDDGEFWLVHSCTVVWMGEWTGLPPQDNSDHFYGVLLLV